MIVLKYLLHILEGLDIPKLQTAVVLLSSPFPVPFLNSPFSEQVNASYQDQMVTSCVTFLGDLDSNVMLAKWLSKPLKMQYGEMKPSFPENCVVAFIKEFA